MSRQNRILRFLKKIFNKLGTFNKSIFKLLHSYFVENYMVYYDTIDNYQSRTEPPIKRQLLYYSNILILVSGLIKAILLTFVKDDWIKIHTGEVLFLFVTNYEKLYAYLIFAITFIIMLKLATLYYEKNLVINWSKLVSAKSGFKLLQYSLLMTANLLYWIGKIIGIIFFWLIFLSYLNINVIGYFNTEYNFSLIVLLISTVQFMVCVNIVIVTMAGSIMFFCITLKFLKLKQDEIVKSIRLTVLWRNKVKLYSKLKVYHDFTVTVSGMSKLINIVVGMFYVFRPVIFSQLIMILNGPANNFLGFF